MSIKKEISQILLYSLPWVRPVDRPKVMVLPFSLLPLVRVWDSLQGSSILSTPIEPMTPIVFQLVFPNSTFLI